MSSMYGGQGMGTKIPKGYQEGRIQNFTPEMMDLFQRMISGLGPDSFLSKIAGGDQEAFSQMEAPAMRQFAGMQGDMASKFSGMGMGGRRSSGFQNTMNQASSDFAQGLQSRRMDLQRQAIKDIHGMGSDLLGKKPFESGLFEKKPPFWQQILMGLINAGGQAAGKGMDMGMMAAAGI